MVNRAEVLRRRLAGQGVSAPAFDTPAQAVGALCAVQAQELADARWSVGQRVADCTDGDVRAALDAGEILRTHVLRPTWHFVLPADIRWLQEATSHRVRAVNAPYERRLGVDEHVLATSREAIVGCLAGGRSRTRAELADVLGRVGIEASGMRLACIVMRAEVDAVLCSGPRRGSQETYALVDERAPDAVVLPHDEAVAELVRRFFTGHGPASLRDLARWSSLTLTEARAGLRDVAAELVSEVVDGVEQWWHPGAPDPGESARRGYLLPGYDEVFAPYPRLGFGDGPAAAAMTFDAAYYRPLVVGLDLVGLWRRDLGRGTVKVQTRDVVALAPGDAGLLLAAARRYGDFQDATVTVTGLD